jgi:hypothetical protein
MDPLVEVRIATEIEKRNESTTMAIGYGKNNRTIYWN